MYGSEGEVFPMHIEGLKIPRLYAHFIPLCTTPHIRIESIDRTSHTKGFVEAAIPHLWSSVAEYTCITVLRP